MIAKFFQINLHTSMTVQNLIMQMAFENKIDILILSELNRIPEQQGWGGSKYERCTINLAIDIDIIQHGRG